MHSHQPAGRAASQQPVLSSRQLPVSRRIGGDRVAAKRPGRIRHRRRFLLPQSSRSLLLLRGSRVTHTGAPPAPAGAAAAASGQKLTQAGRARRGPQEAPNKAGHEGRWGGRWRGGRNTRHHTSRRRHRPRGGNKGQPERAAGSVARAPRAVGQLTSTAVHQEDLPEPRRPRCISPGIFGIVCGRGGRSWLAS